MRAFYPAGAPQLPGFAQVKTYAAHPVWKNSTQAEVKFSPLPKREAVKIWHDLRRFESQTRDSGGQGAARKVNGKISRVGLAVAQALLFDFLHYDSGRLDPGYAALAEKAGCSISSVYRSLVRMKAAGVLNWIQRKTTGLVKGHYVVEQETNAYGFVSPNQWKGFRRPPDPPPPDPETWGRTPPLPGVIAQAAEAMATGDRRRAAALLESDPGDKLAHALRRLGGALGKLP